MNSLSWCLKNEIKSPKMLNGLNGFFEYRITIKFLIETPYFSHMISDWVWMDIE